MLKEAHTVWSASKEKIGKGKKMWIIEGRNMAEPFQRYTPGSHTKSLCVSV